MKELLEKIKKVFNLEDSNIKSENFLIITIGQDKLKEILVHLKHNENFKHLALLSCVDWIEDKKFQLTYILWNYKTKQNLIVKTYIDRDNPNHFTVYDIFPQAEIYEREIREMYGVNFEGNPTQHLDFALEDWDDIPPMRRDFDTLKYSLENYGEREEFDRTNIRDIIAEFTDEWRKK